LETKNTEHLNNKT